jgi:crotonobetainyl-CoA:carnitine CoA-transferase CaiB-like acyl-CoA transferase
MRPLDGTLVLDFTRVLSGPYCTMQLADLGARVIKIEQPGLGDDTRRWGPPFVGGESAYFLSINRNKESVTLDLKHPDARRVLGPLIDRADVVVENFRPGTIERLGLGHERLLARNPRLVYCSISGFGQTGPRAGEPGYDAVMQAEAGFMSITGPEDGPPFRLGVAIADMATGLYAAQGILAALIARARTGTGQFIDIAMFDSVAAMLTYQAGIFFCDGTVPRRLGNRHPSISPYDAFRAADGEFVLAVGNDEQFRRFCAVMGQPALADDPRYKTNEARVQHVASLKEILDRFFAPMTRDELVRTLTAAGVPSGSVRSVAEVLEDPQVAARGMVVPLAHATAGDIAVLGTPLKFSATAADVRTAPPLLGQHTDAILANDVGLSDEEIARLRAEGAI